MKGYWRNPKATAETKTADGWLKTGDVAFVDDEGKFHVVDRIKVGLRGSKTQAKTRTKLHMQELIKVKGNQVAPAELEALLLEHPAVADVAVVGVAV